MENSGDLQLIRKISSAAAKASLRALLIGGHAVNAHGVSRFTEDFDFLIRREDLPSWEKALTELGFKKFHEANAFAQFSHESEKEHVRLDLMLVNAGTFSKLENRSGTFPEPSETLRIVSVEHLIALKLHALKQDLKHRRLRDFLDVVELITENKIDLKSAEMQEIFERYGTPDLSRRIALYCEEGKKSE